MGGLAFLQKFIRFHGIGVKTIQEFTFEFVKQCPSDFPSIGLTSCSSAPLYDLMTAYPSDNSYVSEPN